MNLRKIYERYLQEKSKLKKEQTQNLLINLEDITNQDILIGNKRMNKTSKINKESKNGDSSKGKNGDSDDKKNKENNRNILNKSNKINPFKNNDNSKINYNQIKQKDISMDVKFSKNKNEINNSKKK